MKLLELIVKNVTSGKINHDAQWFMQDKINGVLKFSRVSEKPGRGEIRWYRGQVCIKEDTLGEFKVAEDATETIISREELMRAYDLVEQGYTLWFGGYCPVGDEFIVDVAHKDGSFTTGNQAKSWLWNHYDVKGDIVAYKLKENNDDHESITANKDIDIIGIVNIITQVMPGILAVDAIEIANSLIDEGYHK